MLPVAQWRSPQPSGKSCILFKAQPNQWIQVQISHSMTLRRPPKESIGRNCGRQSWSNYLISYLKYLTPCTRSNALPMTPTTHVIPVTRGTRHGNTSPIGKLGFMVTTLSFLLLSKRRVFKKVNPSIVNTTHIHRYRFYEAHYKYIAQWLCNGDAHIEENTTGILLLVI